MPICNALTGGLDKSCSNNSGGVNRLWVTDFENIQASGITVAPDGTNGDWISAITMFGGSRFYEIKTNKNVCNFTEAISIDLVAGTTFFNQVVTIDLSRRETLKRTFIDKLIEAQKALRVLILDSNGIYWLFGFSEGAYATSVEGGSGTGKADKNGYVIQLTALEPLQAYAVNPATVPTIVF